MKLFYQKKLLSKGAARSWLILSFSILFCIHLPSQITTFNILKFLFLQISLPGDEAILPTDFAKTSNFLPKGAARSWLILSFSIPFDAKVKSFWAWFVSSGRITFQVWRPDPTRARRFTLIGQKEYTSDGTGLYGVSHKKQYTCKELNCKIRIKYIKLLSQFRDHPIKCTVFRIPTA